MYIKPCDLCLEPRVSESSALLEQNVQDNTVGSSWRFSVSSVSQMEMRCRGVGDGESRLLRGKRKQ